ncbi:CPBP family intramembrane glutamic endopeptidase [Sandaracinus amylolyticus]|uniref:CAAX amino terminal protease family protein n=1 Tax=Sandaracinus amylolyticus TaxID=927083 RepID=A0A0F6W155_9BACT|nr:CPBP family intramembrane glutamic endopeptidase [Sandaracinus amylolyticus]AKF04806.1 CAAX amino terminal protease family protein [Sandaracinus amylolyticus]
MSTTFYFGVAFALTWLSLLPPSLAALGVLSGAPETYMAAAPLAVFSPAIAAILAARREGGWASVHTMLRGLGAWRVGPTWLVLALMLPGLLYVAGRAVYALVPGSDGGPWVYLPERPEHFGAILFVPLCEEIGWRGYALPRLIARHGARRATAILGVLWGVWHLPMFVSVGMTTTQVLAGVVLIVVGNVAYTWFFRRTGGSLLVAVLLHLGSHLDNPSHALPADSTPLFILTAAWTVLAIALLALDRRAFEGTTVALA